MFSRGSPRVNAHVMREVLATSDAVTTMGFGKLFDVPESGGADKDDDELSTMYFSAEAEMQARHARERGQWGGRARRRAKAAARARGHAKLRRWEYCSGGYGEQDGEDAGALGEEEEKQYASSTWEDITMDKMLPPEDWMETIRTPGGRLHADGGGSGGGSGAGGSGGGGRGSRWRDSGRALHRVGPSETALGIQHSIHSALDPRTPNTSSLRRIRWSSAQQERERVARNERRRMFGESPVKGDSPPPATPRGGGIELFGTPGTTPPHSPRLQDPHSVTTKLPTMTPADTLQAIRTPFGKSMSKAGAKTERGVR